MRFSEGAARGGGGGGGGGEVWGGRGANPMGYRKGGKVRKTGPAVVHKGERVLNRKQTREFERGGSRGR